MRILTLVTAALALAAAPARAQIGNPLPQSVGLGGNYVALARGFGAVAWNPAGLGMPDNPGFSMALLPFTAAAGLAPLSPGDLAPYGGQVIPDAVKREWLERIREAGGESGATSADVTYAAFSLGPVGFQASSNVRARVSVAPDVAEVLLFGNAGYTGSPGSYTLEGSSFDMAGTTTLAASFALPLALTLGPLPDQHFAIGATVTYTIGNFLALGREEDSAITSEPLAVDVRFPMVHTPLPEDSADFDFAQHLDNGRGIGLDVGAAWRGGIFSGGVVVRNVVNTFEWDLSSLRYREGQATWTTDTTHASFEEADIAEVAPEILARIRDLYEFTPVVAAGAAARVLPFLTVTGEVRHAVKENLEVGARNHVGVGAELTIVPVLPLRAGLTVISGGYQLSGGAGLRLGPLQLAASAGYRDTDLGSGTVGAVGLTFGVR